MNTASTIFFSGIFIILSVLPSSAYMDEAIVTRLVAFSEKVEANPNGDERLALDFYIARIRAEFADRDCDNLEIVPEAYKGRFKHIDKETLEDAELFASIEAQAWSGIFRGLQPGKEMCEWVLERHGPNGFYFPGLVRVVK